MSKMKIGIKQSKKCVISSIAAILLSLVGLILYIATTANTEGEVDAVIVAVSVIGTLLAVVSLLLFYVDGILSIISAAGFFFSLLMFISSQADSIGYAAAGISDIGYGIQPTLVAGSICYVIAVIGECITVFDKEKKAEIKVETETV